MPTASACVSSESPTPSMLKTVFQLASLSKSVGSSFDKFGRGRLARR